jgi:hypothetical protein
MVSGEGLGAPDEPGDPLLELVRHQAQLRRQRGLLPADLEDRLDAHARRVAARPERPGDKLRRTAASLSPTLAPEPSGGRSWRAIARRKWADRSTAVARRVDGLASQVRAALLAAADSLDRPDQHSHPELMGSLDEALDELASLRRLFNDGQALGDLRQRIELLEARCFSGQSAPGEPELP